MHRIVRFRDLEPTWTTRRAREQGFRRWLVTWVGGPGGHINTNPAVAIPSTQCAIGLMVLPPGQRQSGKHVHRVTEIYIVLEGTVEGFDGTGETHRAGPMECTYTPPGCPHGVRNSGAEDVVLVWVHDGIERNDAAVYYEDDHAFGDVPAMTLLRLPGPSGEWVDVARNERVAVGLLLLEPGEAIPPLSQPKTRFYLVIEGEMEVSGSGDRTLSRFDGLNVPAGEPAALRNSRVGRLRLLSVTSPAEHGQV